MKIIVATPQHYYFGFAYSANLFCNAPTTEIFANNPIQKAECFPFDSVEQFVTKFSTELKSIKQQQIIAFGFDYELFSDNFNPLAFESALKCCQKYGFHAAIATSCTDVLNHLSLLQQLAPLFCSVAVKIPSVDNSVLQLIQPGFPLFEQRLHIIKQLSAANIKTGVWISPVLPFINDQEQNFETILKSAAQNGAIFSGYQKKLSLTEQTRNYLFSNLEIRFPQLVNQYNQLFKDKLETYGPNLMQLSNVYTRTSFRCKLVTHWPPFVPQQLTLW